MRRPHAALLRDGRLHLQDGPIDLVIGADGTPVAVAAAFRAACQRLEGLLDGLCTELALLRTPVAPGGAVPEGALARRMHQAVLPFATESVTPMAAVAGAVAEVVLDAMREAADLDRAFVNNGGDIALHLGPGRSLVAGLVDRPDRPSLFARAEIPAQSAVRGIATSGWRGRSFSLGIADAVTILATDAPAADAAATIIANAVDLPGHHAVTRVRANELQPDSDLGTRLVTRGVAGLAPAERRAALRAGLASAEALVDAGLIAAAALHLQGETVLTTARESCVMIPAAGSPGHRERGLRRQGEMPCHA